MAQDLKEPESRTFVEVALTLGGKSAEEATKTGTLDRADEQVEALFAPQYQTANSPAHRAIWDRVLPVELFQPKPPTVPEACRRVMERYRFETKRQAVNFALRQVAGEPLTRDAALAMQGAGWAEAWSPA